MKQREEAAGLRANINAHIHAYLLLRLYSVYVRE